MTADSNDAGSRPGTDTTDLFLHLTPERVLDAVDRGGYTTRAVCYPLASFENRVYEVELADRRRLVAKFYRPRRWSEEQILEEHRLLADLDGDELPVCAALPFPDGGTLREIDGLLYGLWERSGGRAPDELDLSLARRLGMLVGRLHAAAWRRPFKTRPRLDADRYIRRQLKFLKRHRLIPRPFEKRYLTTAEAIADFADAELLGVDTGPLHGDLHLGNILLRDGVLRLLDFDDACTGPAIQDLWLAIPGRDADSQRRRAAMLEGYGQFRSLDPAELRLTELLRGLRLVRYCGWLARRANDPAFQRGWPHFGTEAYWRQETLDLEEQLEIIRRRPRATHPIDAPAPAVAPEDLELTNKDYFWDWPGD